MRQLTVIKSIRISKIQNDSLRILKSYNVDVSRFIRSAIRDKIKREWKTIKEKKEKIKTPF